MDDRDRDNVIKGMELCLTPYDRREVNDIDACPHTDCPYFRVYNMGDCIRALCNDALAILKAYEPRVMELNEISEHEPMWLEQRGFPVLPTICQMIEYGEMNYVVVVMVNRSICLPVESYGISWRCWTKRPTDEQRKAVTWND